MFVLDVCVLEKFREPIKKLACKVKHAFLISKILLIFMSKQTQYRLYDFSYAFWQLYDENLHAKAPYRFMLYNIPPNNIINTPSDILQIHMGILKIRIIPPTNVSIIPKNFRVLILLHTKPPPPST
jgi:hypothetical protein